MINRLAVNDFRSELKNSFLKTWLKFLNSILTPAHTANRWLIFDWLHLLRYNWMQERFELKLSIQAQNPSANPKFALKGMTNLFFSYSQPTSEIFRRPDWLHFIISDKYFQSFLWSDQIHFSNTHIQRWKNTHIFWSLFSPRSWCSKYFLFWSDISDLKF